jgi:hypothetical protein
VEKPEKADEVAGGEEKELCEPLVRQNSTCIARFSGRKCREQIGHALDAMATMADELSGINGAQTVPAKIYSYSAISSNQFRLNDIFYPMCMVSQLSESDMI